MSNSNLKTALVSGASGGLGEAICLSLSETHHVYCFARSTQQPKAFDGVDNITYFGGLDVTLATKDERITEVLRLTDVLINNAAIAFDGLLATQPERSLEQVLDTNLLAPLKLIRSYVRLRLQARVAGNVINISSIISKRGYAGLAAYSASKAGLDGATRALARELGPKRFRVNAVQPGYFESTMSAALDEAQRNQIIRRTPLGRLAHTSDITPLVLFLASDDSRFITGQSITVDGGITV